MANRYSSVHAILKHSAPWVMVTYDPVPKNKTFIYYRDFGVYSNNEEMMRNLSVKPSPPTTVVQFTVSSADIYRTLQRVTLCHNMTVKELVTELLQQSYCGNQVITKPDKVKILFYWLTTQNVKHTEYKSTEDCGTVNYMLQRLQIGKLSYAAFFSLLCYSAGVPCVIVRGYVKGCRYDFDKPWTDGLLREWNAVLVDDEWRLVDPLWGRIYQVDQTITIDEWYLFPEPVQLIYSHFPENTNWQLLETLITKEMFVKQPMLKRRFFQMNMEPLSHSFDNVSCSDGEIELNFLLNAKSSDQQEFLCVISRRNKSKEWEEVRLPEGVHRLQQPDFIHKINRLEDDRFDENDEASSEMDISVFKSQESFMFTVLSVRVRFPQTGYHKLEVVGRQSVNEDFDWVVIYHVNVTSVPKWHVFFPKMPHIGWGPNSYLKECGLEAVSHLSGEVKCIAPKQLVLRFQRLPKARTSDVKLCYRMAKLPYAEGNDAQDRNVNETNICSPGEKMILIPVYIDSVGEFELSVAASLDGVNKGDIIHYRIVAEENQSSILDFVAGEVLKELDQAVTSKNLCDLKIAINSAISNRVHSHSKVRSKYREALNLYRTLLNYQNALSRIGQIDNKHIAVLKSYTNPDAGIVQVLKAVFILLGEPESRLQNWDDIKLLLKGIGPNAVNRRISGLDFKKLPAEKVEKAKTVLGELNTFEALKKTEDVAVLAKWIDCIILACDPVC